MFATYMLSRMVFGNWLLATGGDEMTARGEGAPTGRVKVRLFVNTSFTAALVGIIQALQYSGANYGQGYSFIFDAIVASVIGGVLLHGGYGSPVGIVFGAMTYAIVKVGIYYTGWASDLSSVIIGALVLGAVLANNFLRRVAIGGAR